MLNNSKRARHLEAVITVEELTAKNRSIEDVTAIFDAHKSVDVYVAALHDRDIKDDGSAAKPHYHIYVHFNNTSYSPEMLAKMLDIAPNKVEYITADRAGGNAQRARYYTLLYYTHAGTDKAAYDPASFICSPGFNVVHFLEKEGKQHKASPQSELEGILERCCSGEITPGNYNDLIPGVMYSKNKGVIEAAFGFATDAFSGVFPDGSFRQNIYICGTSGTGKTTLAGLIRDKLGLKMHNASRGKYPLDHFNGQDILLLDDIRAGEPFSAVELLDICAENECHFFAARYRNKYLTHKYTLMTSVYSPEELWESYHLHSTDEKAQFLRRIHSLWVVTRESIKIYSYVLQNGSYVRHFEGEVPNPLVPYLAQLKREYDQTENFRLLMAINEQYTDKADEILGENIAEKKPMLDVENDVEAPQI